MSTTGCKGGFNSIHHTVNDEHKKMNSQEFSSGPNVFVPQKIAEMLIKKKGKNTTGNSNSERATGIPTSEQNVDSPIRLTKMGIRNYLNIDNTSCYFKIF